MLYNAPSVVYWQATSSVNFNNNINKKKKKNNNNNNNNNNNINNSPNNKSIFEMPKQAIVFVWQQID